MSLLFVELLLLFAVALEKGKWLRNSEKRSSEIFKALYWYVKYGYYSV